MSLLYLDGFAHRNVQRYIGAPAPNSWGGTARVANTYYAQCNNNSLRKLLPVASTEVIAGAAFYGEGVSSGFVMSFWGDSGLTEHIDILVSSTGQIQIYRGALATLLATAGSTIPNYAVWNYLEARVIVSDTVGAVEVRVNGKTTAEVTFSGDTKNAGTNSTIDAVGVRGLYSNSSYTRVADLYVLNTTGTYHNSWLGDVAVRTLSPNGNGNYSELTNSAGNSTNNYSYVDEIPASAADYTASATSGLKDSYLFADAPAGVSAIHGVQVNETIGKSDVTLATAYGLVRSGGTDYLSSQHTLTVTPQEYSDLYELDPATGLPWTVSDFNALEGGMQVG